MSILTTLLLPGVPVLKDSEDHWVTVNGQHVLIGADGLPKSGPAALRVPMRIISEIDHREDLDKAYRSFEKAQRPQDVPATQATALQRYAGEGFRHTNEGLRNESGSCDLCPSMDKALSKAEAPVDTEVFRGASFSTEALDRMQPGTQFTDKGYVSTSMSARTAGGFSNKSGESAVFSIKINKGDKALAMGSFSNYSSEREILLPRNSRFEVVSNTTASHQGLGFRVIELKYLGQ